MAAITQYLQLVKPDPTDAPDISVINKNMDQIDKSMDELIELADDITEE